MTRSATLPMKNRWAPLRPCVPTTTRSAPQRPAAVTIMVVGSDDGPLGAEVLKTALDVASDTDMSVAAHDLRGRSSAFVVASSSGFYSTERLGTQLARRDGMTTHQHAAVWLDHQEARVFHVDREGADEVKVHAPHKHLHRHPATGTERAHPHESDAFFHDVAGALADAGEILVVGPSTAKLQFVRYLRAEAPKVEARVVGVETVDHPSDAQMVDFAKRYFEVPPRRVHLKD